MDSKLPQIPGSLSVIRMCPYSLASRSGERDVASAPFAVHPGSEAPGSHPHPLPCALIP
jgi:hypothetical protein